MKRASAALLSALVLMGAATGTASAQAVFVNEIHYDNAGVDQDEGIELAGPAGADLSAYSIELYNGYDGMRYSTVALSGTLPDEENGYGARFFAIPGLQNGAPDGVALIGPGGVEETLGYEGTFTAVNGSAAGLSLEDIGQFEAPSTPVGRSLQLQGTGSEPADFTSDGPSDATPGEINVGQHFVTPPPGRGPSAPTRLPAGCTRTRYSGFFVHAAAVRLNGSVAYFHAASPTPSRLVLRTFASGTAVKRVSYRLDGHVLSRERRATLDAAALSRSATHTLTVTLGGRGRSATVTRTFRYRRYSTLCLARRVVGAIRPARATVAGTGVTVRAIVPPTIKGGAKLRFVVTAAHSRALRDVRFLLDRREVPGQHAMNAGITAPQLAPNGWQTMAVRITPRHGRPVTLPIRFRTHAMLLEPPARRG